MTRAPPPSARSLSSRLRNLCRELMLPEGRVRRLIGVIVTGQLLREKELGAIKGASNIELRLGTRHTRVSGDLDASTSCDMSQIRDALARALRAGWSGFNGTIIDRGPIATPAPAQYRPHRFRVKLQYHERDFVSLDLELSPDELGALEAVDHADSDEAASWFATLGLPPPAPIPTLPLAHQIAQKLHACSLPDTPTWSNDRVHDLIDLQLVINQFTVPPARIRTIARALFAYRNTHAWPPTITIRPGWGERYIQERAELDVLRKVEDAISWVNDLIARIDQA